MKDVTWKNTCGAFAGESRWPICNALTKLFCES